ncbi:MAG: hypothetical protein V7647_2076 [Acidobacteriota bacterium]|jgi:hypothetical protein
MTSSAFRPEPFVDTDRLARLEDVTRRYGRFRPCGAGLGVIWGGLLLGALGLLMLAWTRSEYAAHALAGQTFWRFLRDTHLTPPGWLQLAGTLSPFVAWLGLVAIQAWVDGAFGAVTTEPEPCARRLRGPRWFAPSIVVLLAGVMCGVIIWDAQLAAGRGVGALLAIAGWALVWGRHSRDQLTLLVMFALSVPSIYLMAATDPNANLTAGNLVIFLAYFALMMWLLLQGIIRFSGFVKVRADLASMERVDE